MLSAQYHSPDWILVSVIENVYDDAANTTLATMITGGFLFVLMMIFPLVYLCRLCSSKDAPVSYGHWPTYLLIAIVLEIVVWCDI